MELAGGTVRDASWVQLYGAPAPATAAYNLARKVLRPFVYIKLLLSTVFDLCN